METIDISGSLAVAAMALFYALEARSRHFVLLFAIACLASSGYAVAIESWPFAIVELLWSGIALHRWTRAFSGPALNLKRG